MSIEIKARLTGEPATRRFTLVRLPELLEIAEKATAELVGRVREGRDAEGVSRVYSTKRIKLSKKKGLGTGRPPVALKGGTDRGSSREYSGGYRQARSDSGLRSDVKTFTATKNLLDKLVPLKRKSRQGVVVVGWQSAKLKRVASGLTHFDRYIAWSKKEEQKAFEDFKQRVLSTLKEQGW